MSNSSKTGFSKDRDTQTNTAERCWELLNSKDYQAAKELAQTPLLLTLLCVVYDEFQDFPKRRHALYGEALDVLLRKWASEKRIQRNPIYQELSAELELDMLAEIAYTSFVDDQLFFSKKRLINQIREFLVNNLNAPSHLDAETVLREIEIQQGILVERARDAFSFSHLTFQEYLTAKCIVDNNKVDQLVRDHVTERHWREIVLLVAGLAPGKHGADELLVAMEQKAQTYIASNRLRAIIGWATTATAGSAGNSKAPAKRVAAVFLARALDRALVLAKEYQQLEIFEASMIDSLTIDINSLKNSISSNNSDLSIRREFATKILEYFSTNLGFKFQDLNLSRNDIQQLNKYFYTLELMVHCKEVAVQVSPQVWRVLSHAWSRCSASEAILILGDC